MINLRFKKEDSEFILKNKKMLF